MRRALAGLSRIGGPLGLFTPGLFIAGGRVALRALLGPFLRITGQLLSRCIIGLRAALNVGLLRAAGLLFRFLFPG